MTSPHKHPPLLMSHILDVREPAGSPWVPHGDQCHGLALNSLTGADFWILFGRRPYLSLLELSGCGEHPRSFSRVDRMQPGRGA